MQVAGRSAQICAARGERGGVLSIWGTMKGARGGGRCGWSWGGPGEGSGGRGCPCSCAGRCRNPQRSYRPDWSAVVPGDRGAWQSSQCHGAEPRGIGAPGRRKGERMGCACLTDEVILWPKAGGECGGRGGIFAYLWNDERGARGWTLRVVLGWAGGRERGRGIFGAGGWRCPCAGLCRIFGMQGVTLRPRRVSVPPLMEDAPHVSRDLVYLST